MSANPLSNIQNNKSYRALHKNESAMPKKKKENVSPKQKKRQDISEDAPDAAQIQKLNKHNYIQNRFIKNQSQSSNVDKMKTFLTSFVEKGEQKPLQQPLEQPTQKLKQDGLNLQIEANEVQRTQNDEKTTRDSLIQTETEQSLMIILEQSRVIRKLESDLEAKDADVQSKRKTIKELQEENQKLNTAIQFLQQEVNTRVSGCVKCDQRFQLIHRIRNLVMRTNKDLIEKLSQLEQSNSRVKSIDYPDEHFMLCKQLGAQFTNYQSDLSGLYQCIEKLDAQNARFGEMASRLCISEQATHQNQERLVNELRDEVQRLRRQNEALQEQLDRSGRSQVQLWDENLRLKSEKGTREDKATQAYEADEAKHKQRVVEQVEKLSQLSDWALTKTRLIQ